MDNSNHLSWAQLENENFESVSLPVDWNNVECSPIDAGNKVEPEPPLRRSIYPLTTQPGWKVTVKPHDPLWSQQFSEIRTHIATLLTTSVPPAQFTSIEHIGSTSIPGLCAKPNLDILVTLPSQAELNNALDAFAWEVPTAPPFIKYSRVRDGGGIQGRESLKIYIPEDSPYYTTTPARSVYLINGHADNLAGRIHIRCYRDVKTTLSDPENQDLFDEYARVKMDLATRVFDDSITYATLKNPIVRKILLRAGWQDAEVDEKERLRVVSVPDTEPPY